MSLTFPQNIIPISITDEMQRSYLDYAMSVIVSRAIPDVRDGLKPVQRRILYAMKEGGYDSSKSYKKSARIVGDVMGLYHPHGDSPIYEALVRLGQSFSMNIPLIDGQGNFGSMDGDPPAAMRYTEARLAKIAELLLEDIDKDTVAFQPNYDDSTQEPRVVPAQFPNLLINGGGGIAVGMATNIPPHNLAEIIDACCAYVENPEISLAELLTYVKGPDFPTGACVINASNLQSIYETGRGSVLIQAQTKTEKIDKNRHAIIVTEIPFQVNKSKLIEKIADLIHEKKIEGISDLRDESTRDGVRIVIELKTNAYSDVILKQLFHHTALQTSFMVQMLALRNGRPELLSLKELIKAFLEFREEVLLRQTGFELKKSQERAQVLVARAVAIANIDPLIELIRHAADTARARALILDRKWPVQAVESLIKIVENPSETRMTDNHTYQMIDSQAQAILDLRLNRLTSLEQRKIKTELETLASRISDLKNLMEDRSLLMRKLHADLQQIKQKFNPPRRTQLLTMVNADIPIEDLIKREDMVVMVSHSQYIKRVPLSTYRAQHRGGKGKSAMTMKEEDTISDLFIANTHTTLLLFSTRGIVYRLKVYQLPIGSRQARGKSLVNLLPLNKNEVITTVLPLSENNDDYLDTDVVFATSLGAVRRNRLRDFFNIRSSGLIAIKLKGPKEHVIAVHLCRPDQDVFLATKKGLCIRFPVEKLRRFATRNTSGVRGIALQESDQVIAMTILNSVQTTAQERKDFLRLSRQDQGELLLNELHPQRYQTLKNQEEHILSVSERGYGKRTRAYEYRTTHRGGKGIINMSTQISPKKTADIIGVFQVLPHHQIMLSSSEGQVTRIPVDEIRISGRNTRGVKLFDQEQIVKVALITTENDDTPLADDHEPV